MGRILPQKFFARTAPEVAQDLLGARLVRMRRGATTRHIITEVEAYDGFDDGASHAARGRTKRTEVMYGAPGHWYVFFIYGMYEMLNIVTGPCEYPSAVLIRAVEEMDGPGKLTRDLGIARALNAQPAVRASGLWIEKGIKVPSTDILATPRIGVAYAGEWAKKPWRFVIAKHKKRTGAPK